MSEHEAQLRDHERTIEELRRLLFIARGQWFNAIEELKDVRKICRSSNHAVTANLICPICDRISELVGE